MQVCIPEFSFDSLPDLSAADSAWQKPNCSPETRRIYSKYIPRTQLTSFLGVDLPFYLPKYGSFEFQVFDYTLHIEVQKQAEHILTTTLSNILSFCFQAFSTMRQERCMFAYKKNWIPANGLCHGLTSMDAESAASQAAEIEALQVRFAKLPGCNRCAHATAYLCQR